MADGLEIAKGKDVCAILPHMANRHGLIAGATGTGKTVTLRVIAEKLSQVGVPVFMADVKGDLSGIARPGQDNPKISERLKTLSLEQTFQFHGYPVVFWDLLGKQGHPVRTTASDMGPLLMARLLNLNETQGGVLNIVFKIADDNGLLLLDLKDLRAMLQHVGDNAGQFKTQYGNVSAASIGAIQRGLLALEEQGGDQFFGRRQARQLAEALRHISLVADVGVVRTSARSGRPGKTQNRVLFR
jgi:DNA helicase HerA-like ATPase